MVKEKGGDDFFVLPVSLSTPLNVYSQRTTIIEVIQKILERFPLLQLFPFIAEYL